MADQLSWLVELTIKPGQLDNLRVLTNGMVESTRGEPGVLIYERFISEDGKRVHLYERYADSDAALAHLRTFRHTFSGRFLTMVERTRFTVYGAPSVEVKTVLDGFPAGLGPCRLPVRSHQFLSSPASLQGLWLTAFWYQEEENLPAEVNTPVAYRHLALTRATPAGQPWWVFFIPRAMGIPAKPRSIYQLMLHVPTGERYAFRIEMPGYRVTGCLGPRNLLQWRSTDLESLDYDANTDLVEWANEHQEEFDLTG